MADLTPIHIKKVRLSNFMSYGGEAEATDLVVGQNVIVGRNGSGKSNLFRAITFVLSGACLHKDERENIVHSSTNPKPVIGRVDITIDNSGGRFSTFIDDKDDKSGGNKNNTEAEDDEGEEEDCTDIVLSREVSGTTDRLFVNGVSRPIVQIRSLMQAVGFSSCNPYNIVCQGKATELALASDPFRLNVLRAVAGQKLYDAEAKKSADRMRSAALTYTTLEGELQTKVDRLTTLKEEGDEVANFKSAAAKRRALKYAILFDDLALEKGRMTTLSGRHAHVVEKTAPLLILGTTIKERTKSLVRRRDQLASKSVSQQEEVAQKMGAEGRGKASLAIMNDRLADLEAGVVRDVEDLATTKTQLDAVQLEIADLKTVAEEQETNVINARADVESAETELNKLANTRSALDFAFRQEGETKERRKARLEKNVSDLTQSIARLAAQREDIAKTLGGGAEQKDELNRRLTVSYDAMNKCVRRVQRVREELCAIDTDVVEKQKLFRSLEAAEDTHNRRLAEAVRAHADTVAQYRRRIGWSQADAVAGVTNAVAALASSDRAADRAAAAEYLGTVIDNLPDIDEVYDRAIDESTDGSLLNHVVKTDSSAAIILDAFNSSDSMGAPTFLALNRLTFRERLFPDDDQTKRLLGVDGDDGAINPPDGSPLMPAFRKAFGKIVVCRSMDVALKYARPLELDCVTIDGDKVSDRGMIRGGFINDKKPTRLGLHREVRRLATVRDDLIEVIAGVRREMNDAQGEITTTEGKQRTEKAFELEHERALLTNITAERKTFQERLDRWGDSVDPAREQIDGMAAEVELLKTRRDAIESALGSQSALDSNEAVQQERSDRERLMQLLPEQREKLANLTRGLNAHRNQLQATLIPRHHALQARVAELECDDNTGEIVRLRGQTVEMRTTLAAMAGRLAELTVEVDKLNVSSAELNAEEDALDKERLSNDKSVVDGRSEMRSIELRLAQHVEAIDRLQLKTGAAPALSRRYTTHEWPRRRLCDELALLKLKMKTLAPEQLNYRANDDYVDAVEHVEEMVSRMRTLKEEDTEIKKTMQMMHLRQFESVDLIFRKVQLAFGQIFSRLVPLGAASMTLVYMNPEDEHRKYRFLRPKDSQLEDTWHMDDQSENMPDLVGADDDVDADGTPYARPTKKMADPDPYLHGDYDETDPSVAKALECRKKLISMVGVRLTATFHSTSEEGVDIASTVQRDIRHLSGGQKTLVALAYIFALQQASPAPFYLFDEIDANLDVEHREAVAELMNEYKSTTQYIMTTFHPEMVLHADRCFGVNCVNQVSRIAAIDQDTAWQFVEENNV